MKQIVSLFLLPVLFVLLLLVNSSGVSAQCYNSTSNPKRTDGLVTTPSLSGKFGSLPTNYTSGACVTNIPQAALPSFQLTTYDQLKNTYYDKAVVASGVKQPPRDGGSFNIAALNSYLSKPNTLLYLTSSTSLSGNAAGGGTAVIFIQGNLTFNDSFIYNAPAGGVVFVVQGDIYISQNATQIDAVLISAGNIYTASVNGSTCTSNSIFSTSSGATISPLVINGSLISVNPSTSQAIFFCRKLSDNNIAAEQVRYQSKYPIILQSLMSSPLNIEIPNSDYNPG